MVTSKITYIWITQINKFDNFDIKTLQIINQLNVDKSTFVIAANFQICDLNYASNLEYLYF